MEDTDMVRSNIIACSIMEAIGKMEATENFSDFKVIVEGRAFSCHRFILNACSGFFSALLRSGMKESLENTVTVNGIPSDIFALILQCLYKGEDIVTEDNVFEVWHASNLLQITFLVAHCEKFVVKNLVNKCYLEVYRHAKMLDSRSVVAATLEIMLKEFGSFSVSPSFVYLHHDELMKLVESDDLSVLCEDDVVNAVLSWAGYSQTEERVRGGLEMKGLWYESEQGGLQATIETTGFDEEENGFVPFLGQEILVEQGGLQATIETTGCDKEGSGFGAFLGHDILVNRSSSSKCSIDTDLDSDSIVEDTTMIVDQSGGRMVQAGASSLRGISIDRSSSSHHHRLKLKSGAIEPEERKPRKEYLGGLLAACRISLVSPDCIEALLNNDLVLENKDALAVVREAVVYQLKHNPFWPPTAIHRATSKMENMAVVIEDKNIKLYSLKTNKMHQLTTIPEGTGVTTSIRVVNNQIFLTKSICTGFSYSPSVHTVYAYMFPKTWLRVVEHSDPSHLLVPHEEFLYVVTGTKLYRMSYEYIGWGNTPLTIVCCLPSNMHNCAIHNYATFGKNILLFCGNATATTVACISTLTFKVSALENLDGPAEGMVSFGDGTSIFVLQANGALYKIVYDSDMEVNFQFLTKLWGFDWSLHGAIVYKQKLFLFGNPVSESRSWSTSLPGYFQEISVVTVKSSFQCLPIIVAKQWLQQEADPRLTALNFSGFTFR